MNQTTQVYNDIKDNLLMFQAHTIRLADLVERVPTLIKTLDDVDDNWRAEFVGYWWTLEQVHEEAIEMGESRRLPEERRGSVDTAINGMLRLVDAQMQVDVRD